MKSKPVAFQVAARSETVVFYPFRGESIEQDSFSLCAMISFTRPSTSCLPLRSLSKTKQNQSPEMIPSQQPTTMHWFAMVGEDETAIDLLELGLGWSLSALCCGLTVIQIQAIVVVAVVRIV